jgi:hypothetical protein
MSLPPSGSDLLDTPWGIEQDIAMRLQGFSWERAWEGVIIQWLHDGNVEPLAYLLAHGIAPTSKMLQYFAAMLGPTTEANLVPYRLYLHRRNHAHGRPSRLDSNATLIERLNDGDTSLLRSVLIGDQLPEPPLLQHIAGMLAPSEGTEAEIPYEFVVKHRREGRRPKRRDRVIKMRDSLVADKFAQQLAERGRGFYKVIRYEIAKETGLSEETVRKAYDRYYSKKNRTKLP